MRVVLISLIGDAASAAGNLQRVMKAIDHAAATTPPPDLLVLPGACDTGGRTTPETKSAGALTAYKETLAAKAREWGVYLAVGLHHCEAGAVYPRAVLFDSDGDLLSFSDSLRLEGEGISVTDCCSITTPVGRLVIVEPSVTEPAALDIADNADALLVVPWSSAVPKIRRKPWSTWAKQQLENRQPATQACWALAAAAQPRSAKRDDYSLSSLLIGPGGCVLAKAKPGDSTMLAGDVALPLPPQLVRELGTDTAAKQTG